MLNHRPTAIARLSLLMVLSAFGSGVTANEPPPPGTRITQANIDQFAGLLDETLVGFVRQGYYEFDIVATEAMPPHPDYVAATQRYAGTVALGSAPGELVGYVSGLPFPDNPSTENDRDGARSAWDLRYTWAGDSGSISPFWQYRDLKSAKVERELAFEASSLRYQHRTLLAPLPALPNNPAGIFNALYLRVSRPADIRNTQLLIHRLEDDTQREQAWLYLGTQRRVRRLATGQNTDAFWQRHHDRRFPGLQRTHHGHALAFP